MQVNEETLHICTEKYIHREKFQEPPSPLRMRQGLEDTAVFHINPGRVTLLFTVSSLETKQNIDALSQLHGFGRREKYTLVPTRYFTYKIYQATF